MRVLVRQWVWCSACLRVCVSLMVVPDVNFKIAVEPFLLLSIFGFLCLAFRFDSHNITCQYRMRVISYQPSSPPEISLTLFFQTLCLSLISTMYVQRR